MKYFSLIYLSISIDVSLIFIFIISHGKFGVTVLSCASSSLVWVIMDCIFFIFLYILYILRPLGRRYLVSRSPVLSRVIRPYLQWHQWMICIITRDDVCIDWVARCALTYEKKSSLPCISEFFCLHVNRRCSGFCSLQAANFYLSKHPKLNYNLRQ